MQSQKPDSFVLFKTIYRCKNVYFCFMAKLYVNITKINKQTVQKIITLLQKLNKSSREYFKF